MRPPPFLRVLPTPVRNALRKLGGDLRDARLRRRLSTTLTAERAFLNRKTLGKIEKGIPAFRWEPMRACCSCWG